MQFRAALALQKQHTQFKQRSRFKHTRDSPVRAIEHTRDSPISAIQGRTAPHTRTRAHAARTRQEALFEVHGFARKSERSEAIRGEFAGIEPRTMRD
jgi:hypothetical protein